VKRVRNQPKRASLPARRWSRSGLSDKIDAIRAALGRPAAARGDRAFAFAMSPKVMRRRGDFGARSELTGEVRRVMETLAKGEHDDDRVTHEMGFARRAANRVIYMHTGKVWESGPSSMLSNAQTPELRNFLANRTLGPPDDHR